MRIKLVDILVLLFLVTTTKADFTLTLQVSDHDTEGNCFGDDISGACETFLSIFCLRGRRETSSTSTSDCPLGANNQQIGPDQNSGTRQISSSEPWQVGISLDVVIIFKITTLYHTNNIEELEA